MLLTWRAELYCFPMSDSLERWQTERAEALESLDSIHGKITGRTRGASTTRST